ncbi:TonB-dependent siderophore receptor [Neisseria shayeganii]|uniref:TonB-dependent outer membrane ferric coprogen receptor FitA n=1 Tax=Neisseria shayeganii 871 TaxID=1032488 RepID=G4CJA7_9NEIS|nr:TonB-dependent receptor [Neisseria shayeganii]EGY52067.1 TonB-dependent outer membrane ferric coprogen receptor FitA [Neisseria shayeganii 871]
MKRTFCFEAKVLVFALAAVGSPGFVFAQTAQAEDTATELENIEVTAKRRYDNGYQPVAADVVGGGNTPLVEIPRSVNVVTAAVLEDRRPSSLDEALQTVSGIRQANTLAGTLDAVVKRGFGDNRDNSILRNGMQMSQTHLFSPTAERVEVLKGPASVLYGVQDPGGVVNVVTKQPQFKPAYVLSTALGSHNSRQFGLDFTGPIGETGLAYRLIADHRQSDYWRNFGEKRQTTLAPSVKWVGDGTTLSASYEYLDYTVPFDRGTFIDSTPGSANYGKPLAIPAKRRLDEPFSEQSGKNHLFQFTADHYFNDNWKMRFNYGLTYHTYDDWKARILNTASGIDTATGRVLRRIDGTQDARLRVHNLALGVNGDAHWGTVRHKLSFGIEAMRNDRLLRRIYQGNAAGNHTINMYDPQYGGIAPQPGVNTIDGQGNNTRQTEELKTASLYVNDAAYFGDKWIVSGGLRLDYYDQYAGRQNGAKPGRNTKGLPHEFRVNTDNHGWNLSPQIGAVYRIHPQWSAYAGYATSFRPQVSIGSEIPGEAKPERGRAFEVGAKYAGGQLSAAVAAFHIVKENVRYTTTVGGQTEVRFAGRARSYGLEAEVGGQITERLGINANYAYTRTEALEAEPGVAGLPLNNTPRNQFGLYLTYDFGRVAGGSLRGGLGGKFNGSWYIGDTRGGLWKIPSAATADAFLSYDTQVGGSRLNLRLNGKNLSNRLYYTSTVASSAHFPMIAIGNPREISLSAKLAF